MVLALSEILHLGGRFVVGGRVTPEGEFVTLEVCICVYLGGWVGGGRGGKGCVCACICDCVRESGREEWGSVCVLLPPPFPPYSDL